MKKSHCLIVLAKQSYSPLMGFETHWDRETTPSLLLSLGIKAKTKKKIQMLKRLLNRINTSK